MKSCRNSWGILSNCFNPPMRKNAASPPNLFITARTSIPRGPGVCVENSYANASASGNGCGTSRRVNDYLDEEYKLNISLEAAYFKQFMVLITGPFDENFALPKGAKCDTIKSVNFAATYKTKNYKKGANILRGMVLDLQPDAKDPKKISTRKIYFSHDFRVK